VLRTVDITEISAIVAAAGVMIGVVYYILEMRHQTRIRKTDLIVRLYSTVNTREFVDAMRKVASLQVKDYEDYVKQYGSMLSDSPMHNAFGTVCGFYDFVGILLIRKHVDITLVYDFIGSRIIQIIYGKLKPILLGVRKDFGGPLAYGGFDYLYSELMRNEPQLRKTWTKAFLSPVEDTPHLMNLPDKNG